MRPFARFDRTKWVLIGLFLLSCSSTETPSEGVPPPPVPASAVQKAPNGPLVVPMPSPPEATPYAYTATRKRDPFRSVIASPGKRPTVVGSLPPLQRIETADLRLVGVVWGGYGSKAVLKAPDGKGYTVGIGTRVGLNHGVIKKITPKQIVIEETLLNVFGEPRKREVIIALHPRKEGVE